VELGWEASRLNSSPGGRIANHILNRSAEGKRQKRNCKGISNSSFAFAFWDMDQPLVGRMGWFKKVQLSRQAWEATGVAEPSRPIGLHPHCDLLGDSILGPIRPGIEILAS
jgi:hypothetical protein